MTDGTHESPRARHVRAAAGRRGAVFVELLIAISPVLYFFFVTWEIAEFCAASLVVRRAASAAARAATVVLPDDEQYYGGAPVDAYTGLREQDIRRAAGLVLSAVSPRISKSFELKVSPGKNAGDALV